MTEIVTVLAKPLVGLTVIVDMPATPVLTATIAGLAEMVKSCARNSTLAVAEWKIGPVPVTEAR